MLKQILKQATLLIVVLALLFGLCAPVKPVAAVDPLTIIVNLMSDEPDLYTWDGVCDTIAGGAYDCTLRAAIQHANYTNSENGTLIKFEIEHGDSTMLGARILISQALPSLQAPGTIIQGPNITGKPIVLDGQGGAYTGIEIQANNCEIKDLTISHFGGYGIVVGNSSTPVIGTKITGNLIGDFNLFTVNHDPNYGGIKLVNAGSSLIGGSGDGEGNIISGNTNYGIKVEGGGLNLIQGNLIGLNEDGDQDLPNFAGIRIVDSQSNTIGGSNPGESNYISGNLHDGIEIYGNENLVMRNFIGTDLGGALAIPNGGNGILIGKSGSTSNGNQIGGYTPGQGNVISGHHLGKGIAVNYSDSTSIFGNIIGLNAAQTAALPNVFGITVNNCTNTVIGAADSGKSNVISGNTRQGIYIEGRDTQNTTIVSNYIGVNNHEIAFPNGMDGIKVLYANGTSIGGSDEPNIIANNGENGIEIEYTSAKVEANSIYNNAELGIDVIFKDGQAGVTPNDVNEADDVQNFPGLTNVSLLSAGTLLLEGQMTTTAGEALNLYFYGNEACDPSAYGEGELFLGYITKTADASGKIHFSVTLTLPSPKTHFTVTAWGPKLGNSEFSPCRGEGTYPPLIFDVYLPLIMK